jgi:hypothetical protein
MEKILCGFFCGIFIKWFFTQEIQNHVVFYFGKIIKWFFILGYLLSGFFNWNERYGLDKGGQPKWVFGPQLKNFAKIIGFLVLSK